MVLHAGAGTAGGGSLVWIVGGGGENDGTGSPDTQQERARRGTSYDQIPSSAR